ncbi:hypothetical protein BKA67DRAFT_556553 [Truncatella angustata]|uniref:Uncharacterized protein n=1 Tax=Truncatella angustata TaxID=152316 RepID=A0A9P8UTB0_9PEZI|nr:uncharacterized protein BKA67DRAFT_556553 [Truncatella angustata]KAH6657848.1 hypothetical protein BKA67DRAFT_556553 [Truncatella angustata]
MTCGFFVAFMPTLPRAVKETAWIQKIRPASGLRYLPSPNANGAKRSSYGASGVISYTVSHGTTSKDLYLQIDEEGLAMDILKLSESTERLRKGNITLACITRTTHIVISHEQRLDSNLNGGSSPKAQRP